MIIKSGLFLLKPSSLQFKSALSILIESDVEIMLSYFDLIKCPTLRDLEFVIHFDFLFIVKKSFDIAILASISGSLSFLFI